MEDLNWVPRASMLLDVALHDEGDAIAELLEAGVSRARIRALYPVEAHHYTAAIRRNLQDPERAQRLYGLLQHLELYREWFADAPLSTTVKMADAASRATGWVSPYEVPQQFDDAARLKMSRVIENLHVLLLGLELIAQYPFPNASEQDWSEMDRLRFERMLLLVHYTDEGRELGMLQHIYEQVLCVVANIDDGAKLWT